MNRCLSLILISYGLITLLGCVEEGEQPYPVTGTVTLDGEPVSGAIVAFHPKDAGRPASGITDQSGIYRLTTNSSGDGAMAGDYSVTIVKYPSSPLPEQPPGEQAAGNEDGQADAPHDKRSDSRDPYDITDEYPAGYDEMAASAKNASFNKNLMPRQYASEVTSPLCAQVNANTNDNEFDFQLKR